MIPPLPENYKYKDAKNKKNRDLKWKKKKNENAKIKKKIKFNKNMYSKEKLGNNAQHKHYEIPILIECFSCWNKNNQLISILQHNNIDIHTEKERKKKKRENDLARPNERRIEVNRAGLHETCINKQFLSMYQTDHVKWWQKKK